MSRWKRAPKSAAFAALGCAVALFSSLMVGVAAAQPGQPTEPLEYDVSEIPLPAKWQDRSFEYSGLSWYGDKLVILPQYPHRSEYRIPVIQKAELARFAAAGDAYVGPIPTEEMTLDSSAFRKRLVGYEGLESIAFYGDHAFLTIETEYDTRTAGYVVRARVEGSEIKIEYDTLRPLFTQTKIGNLAYEAIAVNDQGVYVLYELNGGPNQRPRVLVFDHDLKWRGTRIVAHPIEYRITDASSELDDGSFYVMNYHWPGDGWESSACLLTQEYGRGKTHSESEVVERIVHVTRDGTRGFLGDQDAPRQLRLAKDEARNWEGLEFFEDVGFLLISDEYPRTMLGLVRLPKEAASRRLKRYKTKP